jgi:hypothetical protein
MLTLKRYIKYQEDFSITNYSELQEAYRELKDKETIMNESYTFESDGGNTICVNEWCKEKPTTDGFYESNGTWNPIKYFNGRKLRERVECLILNDNNQVLLYPKIIDDDGTIRVEIPGGGTKPDTTFEEQLVAECREEVRKEITMITYEGCYAEDYRNPDSIYDGSFNYVYTAKIAGDYYGHINEPDKDDLVNHAKFYDLAVAIDCFKYNPFIQKVLSQFIDPLQESSVLNEDSTKKTISKEKRKKMTDLVLKVMNILDNTGENTATYKKFYESMSDEKFYSYMKKFLNDDSQNLYLEVLPHKNEPSLKQIKEAAQAINIPLNEYIYYRHDDDTDNPIRSQYKVPVGYLHVKRLEQTLIKKNSYSLDISSRNYKTGNLTGHDKVARITDAEVYMLQSIGATATLKEFMTFRADNMERKMEAYKNISNYGYVYESELSKNNKGIALKTADVYLKSAGLKSDLME